MHEQEGMVADSSVVQSH